MDSVHEIVSASAHFCVKYLHVLLLSNTSTKLVINFFNN
jgi:hypothetical protein